MKKISLYNPYAFSYASMLSKAKQAKSRFGFMVVEQRVAHIGVLKVL
jgi:hypothetical protein